MNRSENSSLGKWIVPILLYAAVVSVFIIRTVLAYSYVMPSLFDIFNLATLLISGIVLLRSYSSLSRLDVLISLLSGCVFGLFVTFTTFYPLLNFNSSLLTSFGHGASLSIILAAGLILMRAGGPVRLNLAEREYRNSQKGVLLGLLLGIPFAILNAVAFALMQGQAFSLQDPIASALGALQPGFVEEVVYRLTFLSLVWAAIKDQNPKYAIPLAALLALLVHNYSHLSDLFVVQPLFAIAYGAVLGILFGVPPTLLALRRNLESAIAFHWIVDFVRFLSGF
jgi:predicted outer membrane lipoprotein